MTSCRYCGAPIGANTAHSASCKLEVRYLWRNDRPREFEPVQIVADAIEQPLTAAEERRHHVDLHLVHEPGREILLCGTRSAGASAIRASRTVRF